MTFSTMTMVTALATLGLGLGFLFAPTVMLKPWGLDNPTAASVLSRRIGAVYLGLAVMMYLARSSDAQTAIVIGAATVTGLLAMIWTNELRMTDAAEERPSYQHYATGHILTRDTMRHFRQAYTSDPETRENAQVSPLRNPSLGHSAPAFLAIAQCDVLRDEGLAYAERLKSAGVEVTSIEVPGVLHGYASLPGLGEAQVTVKSGSQWLASKLV